MTQLNAIRKVANARIREFNRHVKAGAAAGIEVQIESVLEGLAEVADELGAFELYRQITDRQHQLEQHTVLAPITAMGMGV